MVGCRQSWSVPYVADNQYRGILWPAGNWYSPSIIGVLYTHMRNVGINRAREIKMVGSDSSSRAVKLHSFDAKAECRSCSRQEIRIREWLLTDIGDVHYETWSTVYKWESNFCSATFELLVSLPCGISLWHQCSHSIVWTVDLALISAHSPA